MKLGMKSVEIVFCPIQNMVCSPQKTVLRTPMFTVFYILIVEQYYTILFWYSLLGFCKKNNPGLFILPPENVGQNVKYKSYKKIFLLGHEHKKLPIDLVFNSSDAPNTTSFSFCSLYRFI